ncbi:MAG TPA: platelet-activating factor acetylhydrolase IB subunit [Pirellulales bacterium]|nr:platelet-activating factor acetylhydrolase IB subunit [Pirellulales bacterium]
MLRPASRWLRLALFVSALLPAAQVCAEPDTVKPVPREAGWMKRFEQINERAKQGQVDLIMIGDSITQGWEGNGKDVWQNYYGARHAMNAGIGGDRTQHVLWRLEHGNIDGITPKLAVVMIGTNNARDNEPKDTAAGITAIVHKLREKLPKTKILLLAIFPRGETPNDPLRQKNQAVNQIVKNLDDGSMVRYLDIGDNFLESSGTLSREIMKDLLHLTPKGYEIWAKSIEPEVSQVLGQR